MPWRIHLDNVKSVLHYLSHVTICHNGAGDRNTSSWKSGSHLSLKHDDVIKWRHFPRYWPFVRGIHRSQWRGTLMLTLICTRIIGWVNNREAGDLRRNRAHYDVIVMSQHIRCWWPGEARIQGIGSHGIDIFSVLKIPFFSIRMVKLCGRELGVLSKRKWVDMNNICLNVNLWLLNRQTVGFIFHITICFCRKNIQQGYFDTIWPCGAYTRGVNS